MTESITTSFTTPIIRNRRVSSPGPPATVLSHIKKIGISSAASFAFIKFTASGCSKDDSLEESLCQRLRHHRSRLRRLPRRLLSHCRRIRRFHRSEGNVTIGGPARSRVMLSPSLAQDKLSETSLIVAFCYGQLRNPTFFAASE